MSDAISVLIADDHPIFRKGLSEVIAGAQDLRVVAEAASGTRALELIRSLKPAVAVLDFHMPQGSGLDVARAIQAEGLPTVPVFLTMYKDEQTFDTAVATGVRGYVVKDSALTEIVDCIRAVAAGGTYITPAISGILMKRGAPASSKQVSPFDQLSPTERRVVRLIAQYKTSKQIAEELRIHPRTVDNHRTNAASKLGLQGSHALLRYAVEHKAELE